MLVRCFVCCWLWCWSENRCGLFNFKRAAVAWPAGDCPLTKTMNRAQGDFYTMLIEPLRDLPVSPVFAAQRKDGFAVRFQFAARPARWFNFGLWLQIHFRFGFFCTNNSVSRLREFRAKFARTRGAGRAPLAVLREDV